MDAVYVLSNTFTVANDHTGEFISGRRVKLNCSSDGLKYSTISSSSCSGSNTTIIIDENELTSNLISVAYGVVQPGEDGSLPNYIHSSAEGTGGLIDTTFIGSTDTPATFSGAQGKYLKVNSGENGLEFTTISGGSGSSGSQTFTDLTDTPTTYLGSEDKYVVVNSTGSGIEFKEPIIIYGTGDPPDASGYDEGTVYFKYTN